MLLQCSHFISRGNPRVRFDPNNCACLCPGCHDFMGKNPHDHVEFFKKRLGEKAYFALHAKANTRRTVKLDEILEKIIWTDAYTRLLKAREGQVWGRPA